MAGRQVDCKDRPEKPPKRTAKLIQPVPAAPLNEVRIEDLNTRTIDLDARVATLERICGWATMEATRSVGSLPVVRFTLYMDE